MQVNDTPTVTPLELDRAKDPQCHSKALPEAPAPGPAPGGVPEQVPWSWDTSASPPAPARGKRRHQTHGPPSPGKRPQSQDSPKRRQPPHTCLPGTPGLPAAPTALRSPSGSARGVKQPGARAANRDAPPTPDPHSGTLGEGRAQGAQVASPGPQPSSRPTSRAPDRPARAVGRNQAWHPAALYPAFAAALRALDCAGRGRGPAAGGSGGAGGGRAPTPRPCPGSASRPAWPARRRPAQRLSGLAARTLRWPRSVPWDPRPRRRPRVNRQTLGTPRQHGDHFTRSPRLGRRRLPTSEAHLVPASVLAVSWTEHLRLLPKARSRVLGEQLSTGDCALGEPRCSLLRHPLSRGRS